MAQGLFFILLFFLGISSYAQTLAPKQLHPIALQYLLPAPEAPGWTSENWFDLEVIETNHWNAESNFINKKTGKILTHIADYEQTSIFLEFGKALSNRWALTLEAPYIARHEGNFSDKLIDEFHKTFHFSRYSRNLYPEGQSLHSVSVDGVQRGSREAQSGFGNIKLKLKYWALKGRGNTGLSWSTHVKIPVEDKERGMTSGYVDVTQMLHVGIPIGEMSQIYLNAGITYIHKNWLYADWPIEKILWMGDLTFDARVMEKTSLIFSLSAYSPLMKKSDLDISYTESNAQAQLIEKIASGYNGFVEIRGQQSLGLRFDIGEGKTLDLYAIEDWWFGDKDKNGDPVYTHNQPDFGIGSKLKIQF